MSAKSAKNLSPCRACGKMFNKPEAHYTKMHAVFTAKITEGRMNVFKDGVLFVTLECVGGGGLLNLSHWESIDSEPHANRSRMYVADSKDATGKTIYKLHKYYYTTGRCTYGGKDSTIITPSVKITE